MSALRQSGLSSSGVTRVDPFELSWSLISSKLQGFVDGDLTRDGTTGYRATD